MTGIGKSKTSSSAIAERPRRCRVG